MKHAKQEIKQAVQDTGKLIGQKKGDGFAKLAGQGIKNGSSIKDILGLTNDSIEGVYSQAYLLYNTGRYRDAAEIFRLLITLNSTEAKYIMGLAACYHMLKEYNSASATYSLVSIIDPDNPVPFFHASDCFIQMGDKPSSAVMLEMAIKRADNKPQFSTLKERAQITLNAIKSDLLKGTPSAQT